MTVLMQPRVLGRYLIYAPIAAGGMATVYLGRMAGPKGFSRIIAIKQLHAQLATDTDFVTMFIDEAHLIGRIHHSNVVAPIDVVEADGELCIVMEYVHGEALGRLIRLSRQEQIPVRVVTAIMVQTLLGLHSAHEVTDGDGLPLSIVHRDVSPQNILVGEDGISRVVDFGIAKVAYRASQSDLGKLKGKLGYMAPEQFTGGELDRRCDVFSAGIILWEMLTGKKLFSAVSGPDEAAERMSRFVPQPPSSIVPTLSTELDTITLKALSVDPSGRFANAHDMARALEAACPPAGAIEVAEWVTRLVGDTLSLRAKWISELVALDLSEWTQSYSMTVSPGDPLEVPPPAMTPVELATVDGALVEPKGLNPKGGLGVSALRQLGRKLFVPRIGGVAVLLLLTTMGLVTFFWQRATVRSNHGETIVFAASPKLQADEKVPRTVDAALPNSVASTTPTVMSSIPESTLRETAQQADASVAPAPSVTVQTKGNGARADCSIPYVIDAKRIKRFRPECFK